MTTKANKVKDEMADVTFTYDGVEYTIPPGKSWPLEAQELSEEGRFLAAIKLVLGPKQYKTFKSKPRTLGDGEDLMTAMFDAVDLDSGE